MINTSSREQYKILLEQKSTCYIFPNETSSSDHVPRIKAHENENEWEVVTTSESMEKVIEATETSVTSASEDLSKAVKARLMSLRDLGAKKIGNLKMKLSERSKTREKEKNDYESSRFIQANANLVPELLTTPSGPFFTCQNVMNKNMMGAIHSYSSTLSVGVIYAFIMNRILILCLRF